MHDVVQKVENIKPDIILCGGDKVAGQKASLSKSKLDSMWNVFTSAVLLLIDQLHVPFGFPKGNHDASPILYFG